MTEIKELTLSMNSRFDNLGQTLREILAQSKANEAKIEQLETSLKEVVLQNGKTQKKCEELENKLAEITTKCENLEIQNNQLKSAVVVSQITTNAAEQNNRKYNLVFRNMDVNENEDPRSCMYKVLEVLKAIDVQDVTEESFAACHPMTLKKGRYLHYCKVFKHSQCKFGLEKQKAYSKNG